MSHKEVSSATPSPPSGEKHQTAQILRHLFRLLSHVNQFNFSIFCTSMLDQCCMSYMEQSVTVLFLYSFETVALQLINGRPCLKNYNVGVFVGGWRLGGNR